MGNLSLVILTCLLYTALKQKRLVAGDILIYIVNYSDICCGVRSLVLWPGPNIWCYAPFNVFKHQLQKYIDCKTVKTFHTKRRHCPSNFHSIIQHFFCNIPRQTLQSLSSSRVAGPFFTVYGCGLVAMATRAKSGEWHWKRLNVALKLEQITLIFCAALHISRLWVFVFVRFCIFSGS